MKRQAAHSAFTLVELMISIALVVILMLGITKVFTLTSDTAGATNQLGSALRDGRAAQTTFSQDLSTAVTSDAPCMLLCSSRVSAFRNAADQKSDLDYNATNPQEQQIRTIDLNGDNIENDAPGELISPATYNYRSHRVDAFSFFSRQHLQRQTGGSAGTGTLSTSTPLLSQMSGNEAWIWYGHLDLPNNAGTFNDPGVGTVNSGTTTSNENNFYATQWILGREAMILDLKDSTGNILDNSGVNAAKPVAQGFIDAGTLINNAQYNLEPLSGLSGTPTRPISTITVTPSHKIGESRYDLAATSIDDYKSRLNTYFLATGTSSWADGLTPSWTKYNWWSELFCGGTPLTPARFEGNPFVISQSSGNAQQYALNFAQHFPVFLQGCTQFIVEYAGDYLNQEPEFLPGTNTPDPNAGQVENVYSNPTIGGFSPTDGQIDFIITTDQNGNKSKRIRWYGLPRDVDGLQPNNTSPTYNTGTPDGSIPVTTVAANVNFMSDVVPLRDVWVASGKAQAPFTANAPFEKFLWTLDSTGHFSTAGAPPAKPLLTDVSATTKDYMAPHDAGMQPNDTYICAWGPNDPKPKMIRIIITLDDPNGKTPDGQTFEYVFTLP